MPLIFVVALSSTSGGGPDEVAFGALRPPRPASAIPLVLLLFGAVWLFPLITALVAGDIVAAEDSHGTLKTILTRSVERWQIFAGKALAAFSYAIVAIVLVRASSARRRRARLRLRPDHDAVRARGSARTRGLVLVGGACSST